MRQRATDPLAPVPKCAAEPPEEGFILLDQSLRVKALSQGAAAILKCHQQATPSLQPPLRLPDEILKVIRSHESDSRSVGARVLIGSRLYSCRVHSVDSGNWPSTEPTFILHLTAALTAEYAIRHASAKYHLTKREQEVLQGVWLGFRSRAVAEKMDISQNTVKAFLRLIRMKMGVASTHEMLTRIISQSR